VGELADAAGSAKDVSARSKMSSAFFRHRMARPGLLAWLS
jgi:hypothetical protein